MVHPSKRAARRKTRGRPGAMRGALSESVSAVSPYFPSPCPSRDGRRETFRHNRRTYHEQTPKVNRKPHPPEDSFLRTGSKPGVRRTVARAPMTTRSDTARLSLHIRLSANLTDAERAFGVAGVSTNLRSAALRPLRRAFTSSRTRAPSGARQRRSAKHRHARTSRTHDENSSRAVTQRVWQGEW